MINVVYVAGGLNTRFKDLKIFPKLLLPFEGNNSILIHNYNLFNTEEYTQYVIINANYYQMVENYIKANNLRIELFKSTVPNGSYNSIIDGLWYSKIEENILFIWSDLILEKAIMPDTTKDIIIYTKPGQYQFYAEKNNIVESDHGNVPGIYFIKSKSIFGNKTTDNIVDLVEHINTQSSFDVEKYDWQITECRDKQAYIDYVNEEKKLAYIEPRFFNKIEIKNNVVIKTVVDTNYKHLQIQEVEWYRALESLRKDLTPEIYDTYGDSISMEYLKDYSTLYNFMNTTPFNESRLKAINAAIKALMTMHETKTIRVAPEVIERDLSIEFFTKVMHRVRSISYLINNFDEKELNIFLQQGLCTLKEYFSNRDFYNFIHGDPNGSNTMYNEKINKVKFIDPRGYFGDTKFFGLPEYDFAKLNYCLYGYDHFNLNTYIYTTNYFDKPPIFYNHLFFDNDIIKIMTAIIYIALTSYISNNVMKVNIAYHYGLQLLKEALQ